ncbi:YadA-like family protein, partial [Phyllobacterium sp. 0TCS1.6A]
LELGKDMKATTIDMAREVAKMDADGKRALDADGNPAVEKVARTVSGVAEGDVSKASTDAVNGRQLHGLDRRSLKYHWNDKNNDGILDEGEIETATLKLEANSAEGITIIGTKLDNVADGAINAASLEAINGRQMHKSVNSVADAIGGGALTVNGIVSSPGFDIADYTGRGGSSHRYGNVGDALDQLSRNDTAFDKRFGDLASKVGDLGQISLQLNRQRDAYDAAGPAVAEDQARAQPTAGQAKAARILVAEPQVRGVAPASADMVPEAMGPETASLVPSESIALPAGLAGADPAATPPVEAAPSAGLKPIINVGDGRVVTGSSDVVTGGQLKTVDDKVERLASQVGTGLSPETAKKVDDLEQRSVSYEAIEGKKTNKVQLAGGDPNAPVVIANLGDGIADTDGVNVRQLKGLKAKVDAVAEPAEKLTELTNSMDKVGNNAVKSAKAYTDVAVDTAHSRMNEIGSTALSTAKTYTDDAMDTANSRMNEVGSSTLSKANAYTDDAIDMANGRIDEIGSTMTKGFKQLNSDVTELREGFKQLNSDIASVRKEARQAAAIGLAASSLRFDGTPGKVSVAVGGGAWRDASAFAFGAGYTSETGKVRANITGVTSGGQVGVGAGLSITLN